MKTLKKTSTIGLMGVAIICGLPLSARADSAVVQTATQSAVINGDNNQIIQVINQVNGRRSRRGRGADRSRNNAVVQDAYQGAAISGSGNISVQETTQASRANGGKPNQGKGRRWQQRDDDGKDKSGKGHKKRSWKRSWKSW